MLTNIQKRSLREGVLQHLIENKIASFDVLKFIESPNGQDLITQTVDLGRTDNPRAYKDEYFKNIPRGRG